MSMRVGLSMMLEDDFRAAAVPLLEAGLVDVLEWSFDTCPDLDARAPGVAELLDWFASRGSLLAHGVTYSPLSARWTARQDEWLRALAAECERRRYAWVTEHFGFMTAAGIDDGPPLPVPMTEAALRVGRDRLARLADAAGRPVGLENLAFAFCRRDVDVQGEFLDALLEPGGGFLLLDLHNLYCQAVNFDLDAAALIDSYPLHRVRELHVSGGSWRTSSDGALVRRDTHDDAVPDAVFDLVELAASRCPNVEVVVLERLGGTLDDAEAQARLRADFLRLRAVVTGVTDAA